MGQVDGHAVGDAVAGVDVGCLLGIALVGFNDGEVVIGARVGSPACGVGAVEGSHVGSEVSRAVGATVDAAVGAMDGAEVEEGEAEGCVVVGSVDG